MLFGESYIPIAEIAGIKHGHISYRQLERHLSGKMLESYFKFAIVRNPFDRFVSTCSFLNRRNPDFEGQETTFMKKAIRAEPFRQRVLVWPQADLVTNSHNEVMMDFVGHYESLQDSYNEICRYIGIPASELPIENKSMHKKWLDYYDDELKNSVVKFYRTDFRLFGYGSDGMDT